jgi:2-haloacid dehalogenase
VGKDPSSKEDMASMWLISGNPFDVVGARADGNFRSKPRATVRFV